MISFLSLITGFNQHFVVRYQANLGVVLYLMAALFQVNLIDFSDSMGGGRFQQTLSLICDMALIVRAVVARCIMLQ